MTQIVESGFSEASPYGHDASASSIEPPRREDRTAEVSRGRFCNPSSCFSPRKVFTAVVVSAAAVGVLFLLVSNPVGWMIAAVAVGVFAAAMIMGQVDLACGLGKSRTVRAMAITGIALIALFLLSNPVGWVIAAVAVGTFVVSLLAQMAFDKCTNGDATQKLAFECTALGRACKSNESNYNRIVTGVPAEHGAAGALYLGSLPNRLKGFGEHLVHEKGVRAVLSLNEPWEREPFGVSLPYSGDDWDDLGVDYCGLDVYDHHYLTFDQLDRAADFIHGHLNKGENVYVHCRAGQGRSAMAIAAYLIKYEGLSAEAAAGRIKGNRAISTIQNKLDVNKHGERGLYDYHTFVHS